MASKLKSKSKPEHESDVEPESESESEDDPHPFDSITNFRQSHEYDTALMYLERGSCETPEYISFNFKGKRFIINFSFSFSYDDSNGVVENGSRIDDVTVTTKKAKTTKCYEKDHFILAFHNYSEPPENIDNLTESELVKYLTVYAVDKLFKTR